MSNNNIQSETENYKAQRKIQTSQHQAMLALERNRYQQWVGRIETGHLRNITFMEGEHQRYIDFSITHHRQSMANLTTHHRKYLSDVSILYEQHIELKIKKVRKKKLPDSKLATKKQWTAGKRNRKPPSKMRMTSTKSVNKLIQEFETEVLDHEEANKERIESVKEGGREYISNLEKSYQLDMAKLEKAQMESMGHQ
ncbi:hypothetical protein BGAL_0085g00200 [Botrytis galanthina]|uniref:Uncharacterized protein n=1 Tax=Botrytis galanthina TaxID=278940 RepID=A0A4S8R5Y1_9HELO|nr:hypothetical protein BGAL_0085g00200 [Botrytis galanthina]